MCCARISSSSSRRPTRRAACRFRYRGGLDSTDRAARKLDCALEAVGDQHSMPIVMSVSRPAALMRGPIAKPRSRALALGIFAGDLKQRGHAGLQPAVTNPLKPCAISMRLLRSSLTTSATVPRATEIEQMIEARLRCHVKRSRRVARRAARAERRTSHRRPPSACSGIRTRPDSD